MYEIGLDELACNAAIADVADYCRVEVYRDGSDRREPSALREAMGDGKTWQPGRTFRCDSEITLELYVENWDHPLDGGVDQDGIDLSDETKLGSETLSNPTGSGSVTFSGDGGSYELSYVAASHGDPYHPVDGALEGLLNSQVEREWLHVDRNHVEERAKELASWAKGTTDPGASGDSLPSEPFSLNQDGTPFCGPVSVVFWQAVRQPYRLVEMLRSLYERGEFLTDSWMAIASEALLYSPVPDGLSDSSAHQHVDWMLMAAVRESAHWYNAVDAGGIYQMNLPWVVEFWLEEHLGYEMTWHSSYWPADLAHDLFAGSASFPLAGDPKEATDIEALEKAAQAVDAGGVGILLVSGKYYGNDPKSGLLRYPNHYISVADGPPVVDDGTVTFDYHSWGQQLTYDQPVETFEDSMYGSFVGQPP